MAMVMHGGFTEKQKEQVAAMMARNSAVTEVQIKRIQATRARWDALRDSMPGCESDDDEDAIWRHGRDVKLKLPRADDLPELPESVESELRDKDDKLSAQDVPGSSSLAAYAI